MKISHCALALVIAASFGSFGCKKDPPPPPPPDPKAQTAKPGVVASCDVIGAVGSCNEYAKLAMGLEKGLCNGLKGTFAEGAGAGCPTKNEIGVCALSEGETRHYYGVAVGSQGYTVPDAQKDCASPELAGKFTAAAP